jgi:hypothetical protein
MRHRFPLFVFFMLIVSVCFSFYDPTLPSDTGVVAEGPAQIRENLRALKEDQIVDAGTLQGAELLDITGGYTGSLASHAAATDTHGVVEIAGKEHIPGNASFTLGGLLTKAFSELTGIPTTIAGYGLTDVASTSALLAVSSSLSDHIASNGANVHGLGTLSTQNANAAAITGGSWSGGLVQGASQVASATALSSHTDSTTGIHGAPADTRFFTASETIPIANGGTGQTASTAALIAMGGMKTDGTNADSPVFPGAVTVSGVFVASAGVEFRGTASAVRILGNPGFTDLNSIDGKCALDIWGSQLMLGSDDASNTRGSNTSKYSFIVMPHYANISVRPLALFYGYSLAGSTRLALGGGSNRFNAVTELTFHTGATTVTREGTERARFNNIGQLLIATTTAAIDPLVKLKLNGGMEIAPGGFAAIGTSTAAAGYDLTVASGAYLANVVATGTLKIPMVAPTDPQPGMIWFEP